MILLVNVRLMAKVVLPTLSVAQIIAAEVSVFQAPVFATLTHQKDNIVAKAELTVKYMTLMHMVDHTKIDYALLIPVEISGEVLRLIKEI